MDVLEWLDISNEQRLSFSPSAVSYNELIFIESIFIKILYYFSIVLNKSIMRSSSSME